ncbi:MAG: DUF4097 family beta strand repeat protein [Clostridia bacterium]|nr:DUF4097 family beta strand repeat protein [Clostridia bacterium]
MNETVKRLVDLLFEELEQTEEVSEMREEVLNNCQEHYADLVAGGLAEDDALAAIAESLSGMEETLAGYPRREPMEKVAEKKPAGAQSWDRTEEKAESNQTFLRCEELEIDVREADIYLVQGTGAGDGVTVRVENDEDGVIRVQEENGRVVVRQTGVMGGGKKINYHFDGDSLADLAGSVTTILQQALRGVARVMTASGARVTVEVAGSGAPKARIRSVSGDVTVKAAMPGFTGDLEISTTSGDVEIRRDQDAFDRLFLRTVSGDIDVKADTGEFSVTTMSGDMELTGDSRLTSITTTSGDIELAGDCGELTIRTTSGDMSGTVSCGNTMITTTSGDFRIQIAEPEDVRSPGSFRFASTSGDLMLRLPRGVREADVTTHSVSGEQRLNGVQNRAGAPFRMELRSVSGDIEVYGA